MVFTASRCSSDVMLVQLPFRCACGFGFASHCACAVVLVMAFGGRRRCCCPLSRSLLVRAVGDAPRMQILKLKLDDNWFFDEAFLTSNAFSIDKWPVRFHPAKRARRCHYTIRNWLKGITTDVNAGRVPLIHSKAIAKNDRLDAGHLAASRRRAEGLGSSCADFIK